MKSRLLAVLLGSALLLSLCACTPAAEPLPGALKGKKTEYSKTVAYANGAWGGVEITESAQSHTLKNKTARLYFTGETAGLRTLTSLQTGETLLQSTVVTRVTDGSGRVGELAGGKETVHQGNYGVSHYRTGSSLRFPGDPEEASLWKEFDLTEEKTRAGFYALKNELTMSGSEEGLYVSSEGGTRAQFGARYLGLPLDPADHYYLSVTLKSTGISSLKCFFSTENTPLTEGTLLGSLDLSGAAEEEITLTAEITNEFWEGTLQSLLFRLPEGETGSIALSRIAILTLEDPEEENAANTLWTVYSDRIYFSQTLNLTENHSAATTEIALNGALCGEITETEAFVAIRMIDGSVLGIVRPTEGAALSVSREEETVKLIFQWVLSQPDPRLTFRLYVNHTDSLAELTQIAEEERTPLTEENFKLEGASFEGYDPKGGMYRISASEREISVTLKDTDRTVYLYVEPSEGTAWKVCDKKNTRLPIFAGTTLPLCPEGKDLTVKLFPEEEPETIEMPGFFADSGLLEVSRSATVLNGLCSQNTAVYASPDGTYTVSLTATRLKDGTATLYDIQYAFRTKTLVSDLREGFPFFAFELDYGFDSYFYRNAEEASVTVPAGSEEFAYLGSMPFLGLASESEQAGWLITQSKMTAGGQDSTALLCLCYEEVSEDRPNRLLLSYDQEETEFLKGDTLTAQVIRVEKETVDEALLKDFREEGNFRLIQTEARESGTFTAMGMEDTVIIQIEGFDQYSFPELTANGEPFTPEYHVYVDSSGYYGFAFAVPNGTEITIEE